MKRRTRIFYTEADKALMWDRWLQGESLHAIARHFGRHHPSIRRILAVSGSFESVNFTRTWAVSKRSLSGQKRTFLRTLKSLDF